MGFFFIYIFNDYDGFVYPPVQPKVTIPSHTHLINLVEDTASTFNFVSPESSVE